ncbi:RHS repeat-associated core domain-containing protein [Roseibium sp. MMSF_3412]|uniref:RHS repeat-associated core domain-containing protein n=1 Tax=Roseibium sp. MMSF_3412 TaxID=3046712 RepID=UPI00273FDF4D|nr:RHS repeat-associated core domain-containing protein [Roseibium sp. MMSF_3412]
MNGPFCATGFLRKCLAFMYVVLLLQPVAAAAADVTSYTYDEDRAGAFNVGRLTSLSNASATIRYDHDESGNVVSQRWEVDGQTYAHTFTHAPNGQLLRRSFADTDAVPSATGTYQYDGAGRLQSIPGLITHISYNAGSDPVVTTYGNGIVEARTYDPNRRWLMSISASGGQTGLFEESYTRSDKGLITEVVSNRTNGNWQYGYDTVDRLVSATNLDDGLLSQSFAYDAADNITFNSSVGAYTYPDPSNPQPHAVTAAGSFSYSYDVKGNLVSGGGRTITYDGEDRPVSVTFNGQTTSFVYAPDGKRLKKTTGGQTTLYLGADEEITPAGTHIKHPHADVRKAGTEINWMHRDHLSSVKLMSDATGAVISENFFRPYGERSDVQIPPLGTPRESKGWIGERDDPETGLTYLNARYYDPVLARFISPDWFPADMALVGTNRYAYGLNNPIVLKDPSGNYVEIGIEIVSIGLGAASAVNNFLAGNYGTATVDAAGVVGDLFLAATPLVPGAIGLSRAGVDVASKSLTGIQKMRMKFRGTGFQVHHVIPRSVGHRQFFKDIGFDIEGAGNAIALPKHASGHPRRAVHRGRHADYTKEIRAKIEDIKALYDAGQINKHEARAAVRELVSESRQKLRKSTKSLNRAEEIDRKNGIERPAQTPKAQPEQGGGKDNSGDGREPIQPGEFD